MDDLGAPAKLSVNINKYALLRNSRGHDSPSLLWAVDTCVAAGAHGITVHPRADQRHIRFDDVPVIAEHLRRQHAGIEYNIECEPSEQLLELVLSVRPEQCTLVPVRPGELTSDHGFQAEDVPMLMPLVERLQKQGIRVSLFVDCDPVQVRALAASGADRVELYTGPFAWAYGKPEQEARTREIFDCAESAQAVGLGLNAGHDLDRHNLELLRGLPGLREVSIGHAQICRALEVGTRKAVRELLTALGHA
jgi:pyridoxine 5-phosphate synthase